MKLGMAKMLNEDINHLCPENTFGKMLMRPLAMDES
jgi:hypothetical protein